jgi:Xaa-Pro aminopeptidase
MTIPLDLDSKLAAIHAAEYPRFSDAEMARRRAALLRVMEQAGVDHGSCAASSAVALASPGTHGRRRSIYVIVATRKPQVMYMEWYNHWPLAKKLARDTEVHWGEHRGFEKTLADLQSRGAKRIGVMGPLAYSRCKKLEAVFGPLVDLNREYVRLRLVKSAEEIQAKRRRAHRPRDPGLRRERGPA